MLSDDAYLLALVTFKQAVAAFCRGQIKAGDALLSGLNLLEIEQDRQQLSALARAARPALASSGPKSKRSNPRKEIRTAVQQRDRYHCRFTGRRLIDTAVFHEVARISEVFHFDEHHSVRQTLRGPAGHPMVRTHGAAYEHFVPHSCGGPLSVDNIFHTSVQLNESKGARMLDLVKVPDGEWSGLTEYLADLRRQESAASKVGAPTSSTSLGLAVPRGAKAVARSQGGDISRIRQAAAGFEVTVFALQDDPEAEGAFVNLRGAEPNVFFATIDKNRPGCWMVHRLHCSSLAFSVPRLLTASPKVCAASEEMLQVWATRFGVGTTRCSRCRWPK